MSGGEKAKDEALKLNEAIIQGVNVREEILTCYLMTALPVWLLVCSTPLSAS